MNILDFIFPKYCVNCKKIGDYLCPDCFARTSIDTKNICLACGKGSYSGITHPKCMSKYAIDGAFTCVVYNFVIKKAIYKYKYKPYIRNLSVLFGDFMYEALIQNEEFMNIVDKKSILIPIPLSKLRLRQRGFNQSELLAKEIAKRFNLVVIDGLERIKNTKSQVGLTRQQRKKNVKCAFVIKEKYSANFKNSKVILIDDVLTTGSTFSEAANVLKHNGAREVWAIALAKES